MTSWLQIQAVRPSDEGTYRCLARNALGEVEAPATLMVLTPGKGSWEAELWWLDGVGLGPSNVYNNPHVYVYVHVGAHKHGLPIDPSVCISSLSPILSPLSMCVCRSAELYRHSPAAITEPGS